MEDGGTKISEFLQDMVLGKHVSFFNNLCPKEILLCPLLTRNSSPATFPTWQTCFHHSTFLLSHFDWDLKRNLWNSSAGGTTRESKHICSLFCISPSPRGWPIKFTLFIWIDRKQDITNFRPTEGFQHLCVIFSELQQAWRWWWTSSSYHSPSEADHHDRNL